MKNILFFLVIAVLSINAIGQTNIPQLVSFSAVVRDGNNQPLVSTPVSIRLTFREGGQTGPLVYCALHQTTTNQNGFMSLQLNRDVLGTGCNGAPSTAFENIPWDNGDFWMEVEYQITPSTPFENLGQLELASSFYAFAAGTAESISGMELTGASNGDVLTYNITTGQWEPMPSVGGFSGDYNDLTNTPTIPTNTSDLTNNSGFITNPDDADADPTNELQDWTNLPNIPAAFSDNIDDVDDADADATNEIQNLSVSYAGDTLYLQNGGFVIIPGISVANLPAPVYCASGATAIVDVTNPTTGEIWMDRNLGATQAATSSTDVDAYGDLYQWGRFSDGHQCRTSATTATLSSIDQPAHGDFILAPSTPYDWRSPQNDNLWQGVNGINNPCPSGYRIPTEAELEAERLSWSANNSTGALASPLKLPMAGRRSFSNGSLGNVGTYGYYWSSSVSGANSRCLYFFSSSAFMGGFNRALGLSVRCLKD